MEDVRDNNKKGLKKVQRCGVGRTLEGESQSGCKGKHQKPRTR